MTNRKSANALLASRRARKTRQGVVGVKVSVGKEDAGWVRAVAAALSDPIRQAEARTLIHQHFAQPPTVSLKGLLASAPFEGIDLHRDRDVGREIDL